MSELDFDDAIEWIDNLLIIAGIALLFFGNYWGLLPVAAGVAWKYLEGDFGQGPLVKKKQYDEKEGSEEVPDDFEYMEGEDDGENGEDDGGDAGDGDGDD